MSPEIRQFVNHYDLIFDEDMCSLSALLQWMWRSQIRNGKPIDIYIPKNFGAVEVDGAVDVPDHTWDEEAEMKKDTDRFHVLA